MNCPPRPKKSGCCRDDVIIGCGTVVHIEVYKGAHQYFSMFFYWNMLVVIKLKPK